MAPEIGSWAWDSQKRKSGKPAGEEMLVGSRKWEETGEWEERGMRGQTLVNRIDTDEERCEDEGIIGSTRIPQASFPIIPTTTTSAPHPYSPQALVFKTEPCVCLIAQVTLVLTILIPGTRPWYPDSTVEGAQWPRSQPWVPAQSAQMAPRALSSFPTPYRRW